jgi:alginate O-acetyltransferase complex protein AlgI
MHLDSGVFLAVFAAFFIVYSAAPPRVRRGLLVAGSLAFYATLDLRHVPLLVVLGVLTFHVTAHLDRETSDTRRDRLLWLGIGLNVLPLVFFKAAAPSVAAGASILSALGWSVKTRVVALALPVGISFYTLQAISYVVDVHRRVYAPTRSLLSFLASFTLFPHLLSGPIVRSSMLVPQIERADEVSWSTARRALLLFTVGLAKKSIADRLAPAADAAFDASAPISSLAAWTGLLAYAAQLYGDFSGYTDMATALAALLGLELPPNFNLPYLATSPVDFWRRWHISLSTWLRDYVYLPLGVRVRKHRYGNIVATWIVAGLWHGVSLPFFLYGLYHGLLLSGTEWLMRRFDPEEPPAGMARAGRTLVTFYLVLMGYVLFRSRSVKASLTFFASLHTSRAPSHFSHDAWTTLAGVVVALVFCHALDHGMRSWQKAVERPWVMWPAIAVAATCIALFSGTAQPFIYFAF